MGKDTVIFGRLGRDDSKLSLSFNKSHIWSFSASFLAFAISFSVSKCSRIRDEVSGLLSIKEKEDMSQLGTAGSNNEKLYMTIKKRAQRMAEISRSLKAIEVS